MDNEPTTRRRYLAVIGAMAAVAGCSTEEESENGNESDGNESMENVENGNANGDANGMENGDEQDGRDDQDGSDGQDSDGSDGQDSDGDDGDDSEPEPEPSFQVTSIDAPDNLEANDEFEITVTVENTGDAAGDFSAPLESRRGNGAWQTLGTVEIDDLGAGGSESWSTRLSAGDPGEPEVRVGDTTVTIAVAEPELESYSFEGSGQEVRQGVQLQEGLTVVTATHDGESNFIVSLTGGDSEFDTSFTNEIGSFDGANAELVDGGDYILDVNADGNWSVEITQPRASSGESLPVEYSGSGPDVVGPVEFEGTGIANATYEGDGNFIVTLMPTQGILGEGVINEIGDFEGETAYSFEELGWIDVVADGGDWTIEFE